MAKGGKSDGVTHEFGGDWTAAKLSMLQKYLRAYTIALKDKPSPQRRFTKVYIDAFAGTGYRSETQSEPGHDPRQLEFPDLATEENQELLHGSASLALQVEPPFERYIFIEKNAERAKALEQLRTDFPDLANRIEIRVAEANDELQRICQSEDWRSQRAVLFLDPYGMQVDWETVVAVAETKAIDMWLLFPLGIGINRLLPRSGKIPEGWKRRLNQFLGTEDWYEEFFTPSPQLTMLSSENDKFEQVKRVSMDVIGRYFTTRLANVFAGVAKRPAVLANSGNSPLYLFCFAASNENGKTAALSIANSIIFKHLR